MHFHSLTLFKIYFTAPFLVALHSGIAVENKGFGSLRQ